MARNSDKRLTAVVPAKDVYDKIEKFDTQTPVGSTKQNITITTTKIPYHLNLPPHRYEAT